ncbi:MAG: hypothetical protein ACI8W0_001515 [Flavobacterium sp.]
MVLKKSYRNIGGYIILSIRNITLFKAFLLQMLFKFLQNHLK